MKTRFVITKVSGGLRVLATANQGRYHSDTREQAEAKLKTMLENNSESTMQSVFGKNYRKEMKVIPVQCYDHGDAVGTVYGFAENEEGRKLAKNANG